MINHARTLLMNTPGQPLFDSELGEEIIPADYLQAALPASVQRVRDILFGAAPDRLMLNYRTRQYLTLLHETDLLGFVTGLDGRITYTLSDDPFFNNELFQPVVQQTVGTGKELTLLGGSVPPDSSGQMQTNWLVTVEAGSVAEVLRLRPLLEVNTVFTVSDGLSSPVNVPGGLNTMILQQPVIGDRWEVSLRSRPQLDLGSIAATLSTLGEPVLLDLFGIGTPRGATEPFKTFFNLWNDHHELAMSLGGLVLAVIYRTNEERSIA